MKRGNGHGSLYREQVGGRTYWVAAVTVPGSGGKRLKRRAKSEREARRLLASLLRQAGRGELAPPGRLTLGEWANEWYEEKAVSLRASAARHLWLSLSPLWRPAEAVAAPWAPLRRLGAVRLHRLTAPAVAAAVADLLRAGAGPRRVQMAVGHLKACLAGAVARGLVPHNPLADLPRPRVPERERPAWRPEEVRRFLRVATDPGERSEVAPFLAFLLLTGMRVSEGLGLTWSDLALPTGPMGAPGTAAEGGAWAWVRRGLVWHTTTAYRVEPVKTRAGERAVVLVPEAVALLRRRWDRLPPERRQPSARVWGWPDDPGPDGQGRPYSPPVLHKTLRRLCERAEVPAVNVHHLRHVHTAVLVGAGVDLQTVRRHLGHARADITLNRYSYPLRDGAAVAQALTRALCDQRTPSGHPEVSP